MQLNSQFNAQFPDVEETMNKPMDDEKLVGIAFDSGLRFTDSESRESYRRFASFIIANAESEHGEALKAEREVRVMLVEAIKLDLAWIEAERECPKQTTTFQQRVAMCGEAETAMVEALAAAQALDKKEG